ncbi:hypothetical protein PY254_01885 [Rhodanobacter sp. AS-Z3]|uniref:hypothetical protein n=1 Tax=Rhodanobacter sp. AS-Z3 TaxID=3031330 RepID=UPI00247A9D0F|nr:hypothetical protein [Rhodanobacter sp. AS-Z3]WEN15451.1 hypothetical protein PY254_01885 [Rhodanobacter sp. AS-Z3]
MNTQRILRGLAAAVACGLLIGGLASLAKVTVNPVLPSVVIGFVATAIGAFIARRGFVLPALGLWFAEWLLVVYVVYFIAAPTGQASLLAIIQRNLLSIALSALAVAIGALVGQSLSRRAQRSAPAI